MTSAPVAILVADDQADVVKALKLLFKAEGYQVDSAASPAGALEALGRREYDVLLMDLNYTRDTTSGREGLDLLAQVQRVDNAPSVIVMTAWGSVELAVEAMRRGARDFVEKPWANDRLLSIVRTQVELTRALRAGRRLEAQLSVLTDQQDHSQGQLIAQSPVMQPVLQMISRVGASDASVLITGENGTGKGLIARMLHALSPRSGKALVTADIASLSETIFESELFGHVKGAFTDARNDRIGRVELADGGTLFLDEIGNVPLKSQGKLLRVLEAGEFERVGSSRTARVDARIVAATNADLQAEVSAGRFRQDLFFRLNTVEIHLPPLRARREDIPLLAGHFLSQHAKRYRRTVNQFAPAAMREMLESPWPGNVRQLDHVIERAVLMSQGDSIQPQDLGLQRSTATAGAAQKLDEMTLEEVEKALVEKALARHGGNISQAAESLGLSRTALYRRIEKHGLKGKDDE